MSASGQSRSRSISLGWSLALLVSALAVGLVGLIASDCDSQHDCERLGGRVERYDYRTILVAQYCGSGCTIWVPTEFSDWRCVGSPAEARP